MLDQGEGIAAEFEDADPERDPPPQPPCDSRPNRIVTTVWITDRGDEHRELIATAHARWICSFKKCAAQEMQGSWLRNKLI